MKILQSRWIVLWALATLSVGLAQANTLTGVLPTTPGGTNYQAYYDSATNLTWLANANVNGQMNWQEAVNWAAAYSVTGYNSAGQQVTVTGWGLPTTAGASCIGQNCTSSQMGELYYDAGITFFNPGPFSNIQGGIYWSGTAYASNTCCAWLFDFGVGMQGVGYKNTNYISYGWAVHTGNVAGTLMSAPEPSALGLMLGGLLLVGLAVYRRLSLRSFKVPLSDR